ncbi:hypothetical protein M758_2G201500 [Ceratodon purpureus]|nr:hypothetical protein M758_2G201500 [Ceratodon purpureus]
MCKLEDVSPFVCRIQITAFMEVREDGVLGGPVEGGWRCVPQGVLPVQPLQGDAQGRSLSEWFGALLALWDASWLLGNYASLEGILYCKPHFDQLFKMTGSFEKSFDQQGVLKIRQPSSERFQNKTTSKGTNLLFAGTQEKCVACGKTVYLIEKTTVEDLPYHKTCFKCAHGSCTISLSNYASLEGRLYCKHHYAQLFKEKGNYSQLTKTPALKPTTSNDIFAYSWV